MKITMYWNTRMHHRRIESITIFIKRTRIRKTTRPDTTNKKWNTSGNWIIQFDENLPETNYNFYKFEDRRKHAKNIAAGKLAAES